MNYNIPDKTPEPVRRQLRVEAGFGCCKCGNPILQYHHIQYHHIIERSVENHYRPEDMMALCIEHHDMCTKGAILEAEQRAWKATPHNIQKGYTNGVLKVNQKYCVICLGNNMVAGNGVIFNINGSNILSISIIDERLAISLSLYDEKNNLLLEIINNDWISGDVSLWDIWSSYQKLKIRTKFRDIKLSIDATKEPMELRAELMKDQKVIDIGSKKIFSSPPGGIDMEKTAIIGAEFIFDTTKGVIQIHVGSKSAKLHFEEDPKKRLEWCLEQLNQLEI